MLSIKILVIGLVMIYDAQTYIVGNGNALICSNISEKLTNQQALDYLANIGIGVSSFGFCYDPNNPICTSLEGINCHSICYISNFKRTTKCNVGISAGTEVGHNKIYKPHTEGYRLNIKVEMCNFEFITRNFTRIQNEPNGAPQFSDPWGNIFALEGSNWNILINQCIND